MFKDKLLKTAEISAEIIKPSDAALKAFALTCKAQTLHDFVVEWNETETPSVSGDTVKGFLDKFWSDCKTVKAQIESGVKTEDQEIELKLKELGVVKTVLELEK